MTPNSDGDPSASGSSTAPSPHGSRRGSGDKVAAGSTPSAPYVPIWERASQAAAAAAAQREKQVTVPKVFTPVTMKTFSPVLGADSLLGGWMQQGVEGV